MNKYIFENSGRCAPKKCAGDAQGSTAVPVQYVRSAFRKTTETRAMVSTIFILKNYISKIECHHLQNTNFIFVKIILFIVKMDLRCGYRKAKRAVAQES